MENALEIGINIASWATVLWGVSCLGVIQDERHNKSWTKSKARHLGRKIGCPTHGFGLDRDMKSFFLWRRSDRGDVVGGRRIYPESPL
ncbi:hypothetical protein K474DRAFT_1285308 [Panus rudis PR-1116 ss-1]|nr:hypothetical protein K474DRAFT_1285308 [Panus rudis PR-1116 ss-1]